MTSRRSAQPGRKRGVSPVLGREDEFMKVEIEYCGQ
jgi:hypothetical protein